MGAFEFFGWVVAILGSVLFTAIVVLIIVSLTVAVAKKAREPK